MNFGSILGKYTRPEDSIKLGSFESRPDDIDLEPQQDKYGHTIHAMQPDVNTEIDELKSAFNNASESARVVFMQKLVRAFPDEVREYLKEVN